MSPSRRAARTACHPGSLCWDLRRSGTWRHTRSRCPCSLPLRRLRPPRRKRVSSHEMAPVLLCHRIGCLHDERRCCRACRRACVCADPNNLPFSDQAGRGFENKIVGLIAQDLGSTVDYTWWAQRRGYVRHTLKADVCDIWPGVASGAEMMTSTRPYYRSSYVFVTRADRGLHIASFDDPQLRKLIVGVQMVGADAMNTPPAHALARRGIVQNVRGYMLYGDYRQPPPPSAIIDAVEDGDVDVAVVWGPMAGYFAAQGSKPL